MLLPWTIRVSCSGVGVPCAGNDIINMLTMGIGKRQVLRIEMSDWEGNEAWAEYDDFKVDTERKKFRLKSLGKYKGNAGLYENERRDY